MTAPTSKSMLLLAVAAAASSICSVNTAMAQGPDASGAQPQILSLVSSDSYQALSDRDMSGIIGTDASASVTTSASTIPLSMTVSANLRASGDNVAAASATVATATSAGPVGGVAGGGAAGAVYYGLNGWGSSTDWKAAWFQIGH